MYTCVMSVTSTYIYVQLCHVCIHTCMNTYMYTYTHVFMYVCTVYIYTHIYIVYKYKYIYIYIFIDKEKASDSWNLTSQNHPHTSTPGETRSTEVASGPKSGRPQSIS